jgi:hypothetical protein
VRELFAHSSHGVSELGDLDNERRHEYNGEFGREFHFEPPLGCLGHRDAIPSTAANIPASAAIARICIAPRMRVKVPSPVRCRRHLKQCRYKPILGSAKLRSFFVGKDLIRGHAVTRHISAVGAFVIGVPALRPLFPATRAQLKLCARRNYSCFVVALSRY